MKSIKLFLAGLTIVTFVSCTTPPETTEPTKPPVESSEMYKLQWEVDPINTSRAPWTKKVDELVEKNFSKFEKGDWKNICPAWDELSRQSKRRVIGVNIVATILYESGYNPTTWMTETTMGKDPVTGVQVKSEGLMQLSYQDMQWASWCDFDWDKDKKLNQNDPKRTIFDPYKNLECGIPILANEINKRGVVHYSSSYWAVRRPNGKYTAVEKILGKMRTYAKECKY